jgi:hypothetical protein
VKDSRTAINAMITGKSVRPVVAPLWDGIFAAPILGKEYASDVSLDEILEVAELCGFDPILRIGAPALWANVDSLKMESRTERTNGLRRSYSTFTCPVGTITMIGEEPKVTSGTCIKDGTDNPKIYDIIEWYFNEAMSHRDKMLTEARRYVAKYGKRAHLQVGWMTPVELSFMAYPNIITTYLDNRERHHELMELHIELTKVVAEICAAAGFDCLYTSGPPIELVGHNLYEEMGLSYLIRVRKIIKDAGLLFTFHNCGHIKRLLKEGAYNRLLPDMLETLAPPSMGELDDLRWARKQLDTHICTRGNIDLEFVKTAKPSQIAKRAAEILQETKGYSHIVSGADELLANTPIENVKAMVEGAMSKA